MKVGLIGLPGAGVTTLFCTFAGRDYSALCATGKVEINLGETKVPDLRVDRLTEIFQPKKSTHAVIEFADVPVDLEPSGGLSAKTLSAIRTMDALAIIIRAFENPAVPHPNTTINPLRDLNSFWEEAVLTDMIQMENRLEKLKKEGKQKSREAEIFNELKDQLENNKTIRDLNPADDVRKLISGFKCISEKPWLVILNTDPDNSIDITPVSGFCDENNLPWLTLAGQMELEISALDPDEQAEFLADIGQQSDARSRFIRGAYEHLNLISFLTTGPDECRAWSIEKGCNAQEAAGKIHSDLAKGFIRAEVISYQDFIDADCSMAVAKKAGKVRLEGKTYIVQDGDIMNIRFNV